MKVIEDHLQIKLAELEAGQLLEVSQAGLPADEAELIGLAAQLQTLEIPARDPEVVTVQRKELLRMALNNNQQTLPGVRSRPTLRLSDWFSFPVALTAAGLVIIVVGFLFYNLGKTPVDTVPPDAQTVQDTSPGSAAVAVAQTTSTPTRTATKAPTATIPPTATSSPTVHLSATATPTDAPAPLVSAPLVFDAQTARLGALRGLVEVQEAGSNWATLTPDSLLSTGARLRTGPLSSAELTFFDGSIARLGPNTEISLDELNANPRDAGARVVVLTQWRGESDHQVATRTDTGSQYLVNTPTGSGIAMGTAFQVLVSANLLTQFIVTEGTVNVVNLNVTVAVVAGQSSTILPGQAPSDPHFFITGQGEVTQTGDVWVIGGQAFRVDANTVIVGDPQEGDLARVIGHLVPDDMYQADRIVLLRRAVEERFTLTGEVESMAKDAWTIAGEDVMVNDETEIDPDISTGDLVRATGIIQSDGTLLAESIVAIDEEPGSPFSFSGLVESMADTAWTVSGVTVSVDEETSIDEELAEGDLVAVQGWILPDGTWLAESIVRLSVPHPAFEFTGEVEGIDPWLVAGISFETAAWTSIESEIEVGDRVRVRGTIMADGTWIAASIERLDDDLPYSLVLVGTVNSIDPWLVNGIPFTVNDETVIGGEVAVGSLVRVKITVLPDGTWLAVHIQVIEPPLVTTCFNVSSAVVNVSGSQVILYNWPAITLGNDIQVTGNLTPNSVITFVACFDVNGALISVNNIVVIIQVTVTLPTLTPTPSPTPTATPLPTSTPLPVMSEETTVCHRPPGNPANAKTLTVGASAVQAHLGHGDSLGACSDNQGENRGDNSNGKDKKDKKDKKNKGKGKGKK